MIEFEEVGRRYGGGRRRVDALRGVSLVIPRGRVVAVVGPNGAGKSTLFALALGFLGPTAGRVTIEGSDPRLWIRARGVGYLPERFALPPEWPVARGLRALARMETADPDAAVSRGLARWGLEGVAERRAGALSRGLLQRVGLAQATLSDHALVVLDEPTEGLDPLWRVRLRDEVGALRRSGATVLMASHDLAEVERVADQVVLMDRGRVVEVVESGVQPEAGLWRLRLAAPFAVDPVFPGAMAQGHEGEWVVGAEGVADLSARLAALLAQGALLESVAPEAEGLEERVKRTLEPPNE